MNIHEKISKDMLMKGGFLSCNTCGSVKLVGDISKKLAKGWPQCHGQTMVWTPEHRERNE